MTRICLTPRVHGVGGMVSFQAKLAQGLDRRGVQVCTDLDDWPYDAVLVIGGTRDLRRLWRARRRGIRVVQRLNGMNWLHRRVRTGLRHFLRAELGNHLLALIRARLADAIIYQSHFAHGWWERIYGPTRAPAYEIYNGVDLATYTPDGPGQPPAERHRLLVVEGSLGGGYEMGLETAVALAEHLEQFHRLWMEVMVVGRVAPALQAIFKQRAQVPLQFAGLVKREQIAELDRSAHLLYAADINAACPNSVVEALACGLPVVSFDTGALPELVNSQAGRIVPYGGDPWRLDPPDLEALARGAADVLADQPLFRAGARRRAEDALGLERMVDGYLDVLTAR